MKSPPARVVFKILAPLGDKQFCRPTYNIFCVNISLKKKKPKGYSLLQFLCRKYVYEKLPVL